MLHRLPALFYGLAQLGVRGDAYLLRTVADRVSVYFETMASRRIRTALLDSVFRSLFPQNCGDWFEAPPHLAADM